LLRQLQRGDAGIANGAGGGAGAVLIALCHARPRGGAAGPRPASAGNRLAGAVGRPVHPLRLAAVPHPGDEERPGRNAAPAVVPAGAGLILEAELSGPELVAGARAPEGHSPTGAFADMIWAKESPR